jgi:hypothetical protein
MAGNFQKPLHITYITGLKLASPGLFLENK